MNVRIGNDIRLNLTLKGPRNYDQANIKQLRAYLINTSMQDFDGPFEPCMCSNSGCRINACGKGGYFHDPSNFHHCCDGCCDYKYWLRPCKPFGPCPLHHHHRGPFHPHLWWDKPVLAPGRVPFNVALVEGPLPPKYGPGCDCGCECDGHCHPWHKPCSHPHPGMGCGFCGDPAPTHINEDFRYLAPSRVLEEKNRIQVYFPACDQYACGVYKLVIVLVVYEAGWGRCDLHTYTIDYGDVLTLVDDNSGVSGDITLDIDNNTMSNSDIVDINVKSANYYMYPNSNLPLGKSDNRGNTYEIEVTLSNGATVKYTTDRDNWPYEDYLDFSSTVPSVAAITDAHGTVHSQNVADGSQADIVISSHKNPLTSTSARIYIESAGQVNIPVETINAPNNVTLNVGQNVPLDIQILPADHTQNVIYNVIQNGEIFRFENGRVYGISAGQGDILITAGGIQKTIHVVVNEPTTPTSPLQGFNFTSPITMYPKQTIERLSLYINGAYPSNAVYSMLYTSMDSTVGSVVGEQLTAKKVGTTTITATSNNGVSRNSTLNVVFPYQPLEDLKLETGQDHRITPVGASSVIPIYTLSYEVLDSSGNPSNIATVNSNGYLVALRAGNGKVRMWIDRGQEWASYIDFNLEVVDSADSTLVVTPTVIEFAWDDYYDVDQVGQIVTVETTGDWTAEEVID